MVVLGLASVSLAAASPQPPLSNPQQRAASVLATHSLKTVNYLVTADRAIRVTKTRSTKGVLVRTFPVHYKLRVDRTYGSWSRVRGGGKVGWVPS